MDAQKNLFEHALIDRIAAQAGPITRLTLTDNRKSLVSIRWTGKAKFVRLSRIFAFADDKTLDDLARYIRGEARRLPPSVFSFADRQPLPPHVAKKALLKLDSKGEFHDLRRVMSAVDKKYFGGEMKVNITWGRGGAGKHMARKRTIQLGSYDKDLDLVTIHPALDSAETPIEYVGLIVYHEMLHKKVATVTLSNGRRVSHSREFKRLEREYEQYAQIMEWEKKNLGRILRSRGGKQAAKNGG